MNRDVSLDEKMTKLVKELDEMGVRLLPKTSGFHEDIHVLLVLVTLGGQRGYLTDYVTTIGRTIYVPADWDQRTLADRYATLRHERVHVRQFARYGLFVMAFAYLFLPLPIGLAWCRYRLEQEAYEESMRAAYELGGVAALDGLRDHVIAQFVSASYAWMWPFPGLIRRWYDDTARAIAEAQPVG